MHDDPQTRLRQAARELAATATLPPPQAVRARGHQRRRRRALGSGLLVLALLAGGATAYLTVARQQPAAGPLTRSTGAHSMLPAGKVGPRSAVPWPQVGPGWTLAVYTQGWPYDGRVSLIKPTILYLVDPLGGRYQMYRWPASQPGGWGLLDWSSDGTRALFVSVTDGRQVMHQLVLATGAVRSFTLSARAYPIGYTGPGGSSLLAVSGKTVKGHGVVQRFGLTGALQATLATGTSGAAASSPDGATVAIGTPTGIEMVAAAGGHARRVTITGVNPRSGCHPVRWWDPSTVLVGCQVSYGLSSRLWLVPANGGKASALTPAPGLRPGYFLAWQLRSGLYLLGMAGDGCGTVMVKRAADGPGARVRGQGSGAMDVLAVTGGRMLVKWERTCSSGYSLTWFTPASGAAATLLPAPADGQGVMDAIPYGGQHG